MSINIKKLEKIIKSQNMLDFQFFFNLNKPKNQQTNITEIKYYLNLIPSNKTNPIWWSAIPDVTSQTTSNDLAESITNTFTDFLFEYGANINSKNTYGQTLLLKACEDENIPLFNHLLHYNTLDINATDDKHMSALHYSCYNYNPYLIKKLIDFSIDTNIKDIHNWTAFHTLLFGVKHPLKDNSVIKENIPQCILAFIKSNLTIDLQNDKILNTYILTNPQKFILIKNILDQIKLK
jgi:hypothetical protein